MSVLLYTVVSLCSKGDFAEIENIYLLQVGNKNVTQVTKTDLGAED